MYQCHDANGNGENKDRQETDFDITLVSQKVILGAAKLLQNAIFRPTPRLSQKLNQVSVVHVLDLSFYTSEIGIR